MMTLHVESKLLFLTIWLVTTSNVNKSLGNPISDHITLYNQTDHVYELFDETIAETFDSGKIWIVEFYAHWCGHCQRFAPAWKKVADKFSVWNEWVTVAAINCAQQDCQDYNIQGTPSVRLFGPRFAGPTNGSTGVDIVAVGEAEFWYSAILENIELLQREEQLDEGLELYETLISQGLPSLMRYDPNNKGATKFSTEPPTPTLRECHRKYNFLVAFLESSEVHGLGNKNSSDDMLIGRRAILELYDSFFDVNVNRVSVTDIPSFMQTLSLYTPTEDKELGEPSGDISILLHKNNSSLLPDTLELPGLLIFTYKDEPGICTPVYKYHPVSIRNLTIPENPTYAIIYKLIDEYSMEIITNITRWIEEDIGIKSVKTEIEEMDANYINTTNTSGYEELPYDGSDVVVPDDIERAIRYSLLEEIPAHAVLDHSKIKTLYNWISALMKYLPLRKPVFDFLKNLRQHLYAVLLPREFKNMTSLTYDNIIKKLIDTHLPFNDTSSKWIGCMGSDPKFRGYPCSLWQTFHSITVGSILADEVDLNEGVAKTIFDYIEHFFTCRHCAEHFIREANYPANQPSYVGKLPIWPSDTAFWMWRLHNMANLRLKGDITEDPEHPKIFWPSNEACPLCYSVNSSENDRNNMVMIAGNRSNTTTSTGNSTYIVNKMEVTRYLIKVYGSTRSHVRNNNTSTEDDKWNCVDGKNCATDSDDVHRPDCSTDKKENAWKSADTLTKCQVWAASTCNAMTVSFWPGNWCMGFTKCKFGESNDQVGVKYCRKSGTLKANIIEDLIEEITHTKEPLDHVNGSAVDELEVNIIQHHLNGYCDDISDQRKGDYRYTLFEG